MRGNHIFIRFQDLYKSGRLSYSPQVTDAEFSSSCTVHTLFGRNEIFHSICTRYR